MIPSALEASWFDMATHFHLHQSRETLVCTREYVFALAQPASSPEKEVELLKNQAFPEKSSNLDFTHSTITYAI